MTATPQPSKQQPISAVPAPAGQFENITITELVLPTWEDRHCDECGMLEPHHRVYCQWKDID